MLDPSRVRLIFTIDFDEMKPLDQAFAGVPGVSATIQEPVGPYFEKPPEQFNVTCAACIRLARLCGLCSLGSA